MAEPHPLPIGPSLSTKVSAGVFWSQPYKEEDMSDERDQFEGSTSPEESGSSSLPAAQRAAGAAAARHGAVPELVHAAGGGARELGPADRRSGVERQPHRGVHAARSERRRAAQGRPVPVGTASHIHKMFKLPDGSLRIIVQGLARVRLTELVNVRPYLRARIEEARRSARATRTGSRSTRCSGTSRPTFSRSSRCRR